jgi:uncharacterized membrane-anchored protein YitT (DUF2179 family)
MRRWPPARYWVAIVLLAAETRFLEKASHVSSGGLSGVALALDRWTGLPVGILTLLLKLVVLALVWRLGGRRALFWTFVAAVGGGLLTYAFEQITFRPLPLAYAVPAILVFSYFPSSLLISCGYSSGGFSALAQLLERWRVPVGVTLSALNGLSLLLMYLAFGRLSGALSLLATLLSGLDSQFWVYTLRRLFPAPPALGS